jgi:uncharacterized Tic20 family protein
MSTMNEPENTQETSQNDEAVSQDDRNLGMLCHLIALVGLLIPFGNILGPLVIWLVKKDQSSFVDTEGKEALNFNITVAIAGFVSFLLMAVAIGFVLVVIVAIFWIVMAIVAASKASSGEHYRYPLTIRLVQ